MKFGPVCCFGLWLLVLSLISWLNQANAQSMSDLTSQYERIIREMVSVTSMSDALQYYYETPLRQLGSKIQDEEIITAFRGIDQYEGIEIKERREFVSNLLMFSFLRNGILKSIVDGRCDDQSWPVIRSTYQATFGALSLELCSEFNTCVSIPGRPMSSNANHYVESLLSAGEELATARLSGGISACNSTSSHVFEEFASNVKEMTEVVIIQFFLKYSSAVERNWKGQDSSSVTREDVARASAAAWALNTVSQGCSAHLNSLLTNNFVMGSSNPLPDGLKRVTEELRRNYESCYDVTCQNIGQSTQFDQVCLSKEQLQSVSCPSGASTPEGITLIIILTLMGASLLVAIVMWYRTQRSRRFESANTPGIGEANDLERVKRTGGSTRTIHNSHDAEAVSRSEFSKV